ncbi:odorant receptor 46a-like [Zophobas morio]|uniref:odorant receptor 46a-like n=1 Tax=Zophobas morio TaxID=2755281 RepID=UPI0030832CA5
MTVMTTINCQLFKKVNDISTNTLLAKQYLPDYCHSYVLEALYLLSYPVVGYMFVQLAYALLYFVSHVKFQLYMTLDMIEHIAAEYDEQSDDDLLNCDEYQNTIKARLVLMVTKLTEVTRVANLAASMLAVHFIPPLAMSAVLIGLSLLSFVYLEQSLGYWCYFQNFLWCVSSTSTLIIYAHCGQEFENNTMKVFDTIYATRWTSFNTSNRKIILITMIMFQEPMKLKFSESVSCNYELGVRISRAVYSFAAVMARVSDSQSNK